MAKAPKNRVGSAVRHAAYALRAEILGRPDGTMLGSESDLVARLKVSRPTFRQAAKLVEQEQLLLIKRGVGGGFFTRRPSVQAVTHVASVYLLSRKATMADAIRTARPLFAETARLGASRKDPVNNQRIAAFLVQQQAAGSTQLEPHNFLKFEKDFQYLFASLSGNPVLELYTEVLVDFAGGYVGSSVYAGHPERIAKYCPVRNELLEAVMGGDEQIAQLLSYRRSDLIVGWLEQDLASAQPPSRSSGRSQASKRELIGLSASNSSSAASGAVGKLPKVARGS
jgi:GntR family transcriptional repressor for pyruvate dehydrogenase complex